MKKVICMTSIMLIVCLMFSSISVSAGPSEKEYEYMDKLMSNVDLTYKEEIEANFYPEKYEGRTNLWIYYNMLYAEKSDTEDEPDYVVFIAWTGVSRPADVSKYFGDYRVFSFSMEYPYDLGYYVYVPAQKKVYTLEEAWESEELDITNAFESGCVGIHRADVNMDTKCDILDATYTQMYLAGIDGYKRNYRMDFDSNDDINILDVTAFQRYLVGLE